MATRASAARLLEPYVRNYSQFKGVPFSSVGKLLTGPGFDALLADPVRGIGPVEETVYPWNVVDQMVHEIDFENEKRPAGRGPHIRVEVSKTMDDGGNIKEYQAIVLGYSNFLPAFTSSFHLSADAALRECETWIHEQEPLVPAAAPEAFVRHYREHVTNGEAQQLAEVRDEFRRMAARMREEWTAWHGEDSLHEMAFGEESLN